jgi:hypothetical protein
LKSSPVVLSVLEDNGALLLMKPLSSMHSHGILSCLTSCLEMYPTIEKLEKRTGIQQGMIYGTGVCFTDGSRNYRLNQ